MRNFMHERTRQLATELNRESDNVLEQIRPILANRNPVLQGCVIAELLAIYLGGHHPKTRKGLLKHMLKTTLKMVELHDPWA